MRLTLAIILNFICLVASIPAQERPLKPSERSPVPLTDKDQERLRLEREERSKLEPPRSEELPIEILSFACPSKLKGERTKKVAWIKINNIDSRGRAINYLEWTVFVYDLEISKEIPVKRLLARSEKQIEAGKEGGFQHVIRNPIDTRNKHLLACITLIAFADGTEWRGSTNGHQRNCYSGSSSSAQETRRDSNLRRVKYEVTYSETGGYVDDGKYLRVDDWSANLTYANEQGGTSQESDAKLTWSKTFLAERGQRLYISAQESRGSRIGAITVWLYVDDRLVKRSTSKGAYAIATASGRL